MVTVLQQSCYFGNHVIQYVVWSRSNLKLYSVYLQVFEFEVSLKMGNCVQDKTKTLFLRTRLTQHLRRGMPAALIIMNTQKRKRQSLSLLLLPHPHVLLVRNKTQI